MEDRDIEAARILHNDPRVLEQLTDTRVVSEEEQRRWFKSISQSGKSWRIVIEDAEVNDLIGVFRIDSFDPRNRNAMIGLDIASVKQGRGYAKIVYRWMMNYLFDELGLHRLGLVTRETNTVAVNLYRSLGFVEEGRLKEAILLNDKFIDVICFGYLSSQKRP